MDEVQQLQQKVQGLERKVEVLTLTLESTITVIHEATKPFTEHKEHPRTAIELASSLNSATFAIMALMTKSGSDFNAEQHMKSNEGKQ